MVSYLYAAHSTVLVLAGTTHRRVSRIVTRVVTVIVTRIVIRRVTVIVTRMERKGGTVGKLSSLACAGTYNALQNGLLGPILRSLLFIAMMILLIMTILVVVVLVKQCWVTVMFALCLVSQLSTCYILSAGWRNQTTDISLYIVQTLFVYYESVTSADLTIVATNVLMLGRSLLESVRFLH